MSAYINIIIGIVFIAGGMTKKMALWGTDSPEALAAVGLIPLGMGIYQLYAKHKRRGG